IGSCCQFWLIGREQKQFPYICLCQLSVSRSKRVVYLDGLFKGFDCRLITLSILSVEIKLCAQIVIVSIRIHWTDISKLPLFLRRQFDPCLANDVLRHVSLQRKCVTKVAFVA